MIFANVEQKKIKICITWKNKNLLTFHPSFETNIYKYKYLPIEPAPKYKTKKKHKTKSQNLYFTFHLIYLSKALSSRKEFTSSGISSLNIKHYTHFYTCFTKHFGMYVQHLHMLLLFHPMSLSFFMIIY